MPQTRTIAPNEKFWKSKAAYRKTGDNRCQVKVGGLLLDIRVDKETLGFTAWGDKGLMVSVTHWRLKQ